MKIVKFLGLASVVVIMTGCASAASPVTGALFMDAKGPVAVTTNAAATKSGTACAKSILGWVGLGDASIDAAKKAGGITEVSSVDHASTNILGLYATFCLTVNGK